jgi:hypothetical protein
MDHFPRLAYNGSSSRSNEDPSKVRPEPQEILTAAPPAQVQQDPVVSGQQR